MCSKHVNRVEGREREEGGNVEAVKHSDAEEMFSPFTGLPVLLPSSGGERVSPLR